MSDQTGPAGAAVERAYEQLSWWQKLRLAMGGLEAYEEFSLRVRLRDAEADLAAQRARAEAAEGDSQFFAHAYCTAVEMWVETEADRDRERQGAEGLAAELADAQAEIRRHHADFERWEEMAAKGAQSLAERERLAARVAVLEKALAEAAIPLEAFHMDLENAWELSDAAKTEIRNAVRMIRRTLRGEEGAK